MSCRRSKIIKITVARESLDVKIGVSLREEEEEEEDAAVQEEGEADANQAENTDNENKKKPRRILINTIAPDSLFAHTRLQPGMQLLKINHVSLVQNDDEGMVDIGQAMKLLREAEEVVTLEASVIEEEERETRQVESQSMPSSTSTSNATSAAAPSPSRSVENTSEASSAVIAHDVLLVSNDQLNNPNRPRDQPAPTPTPAGPVAVASTLETTTHSNIPTEQEMIIPMASAEPLLDDDDMSVATHDKNYFISSSHSRTNSHDTQNSHYVDATDMCVAYPAGESTSTRIPKITRNVLDDNGIATVTATKPSPTAAIGIALKKNARGKAGVFISSFKSFSIFQGTHLQPGMQILAINGHDCSHDTSPDHVAQLLKHCDAGHVTLVARFVSPYLTSNTIVMEELEPTMATANDHTNKNNEPRPKRKVMVATVTATKPNPRTKVGLHLRETKGLGIVISSLNPSSLFGGSHLQAGMKLLSINGLDITDTSPKYCGMLLRNIEQEVTLVAREALEGEEEEEEEEASNTNEAAATTATAEVPTENDVSDETAAAQTDSNDGTSTAEREAATLAVTEDSSHAANHSEDGSNPVDTKPNDKDSSDDGDKDSHNETAPPREALPHEGSNDSEDSNPPEETKKMAPPFYLALAGAVIDKPDSTSELGITIGEKTLLDGRQIPVIVDIASGGLCANTELEVGMRLLSVDGIGCRGVDDATAMLQEAKGGAEVTILASPSWHIAFATVTKATKDTKVGLVLRRKENGMVVIKHLAPDGLFTQTGVLKEGMRVCTINGSNVDELKEGRIGAVSYTHLTLPTNREV